MKTLIVLFLNLDKKDRAILLLLFATIGNILFAGVKFVFSFVIPSFWFFVNACFLSVLSIARFFLIRSYGRQKRVLDDEFRKRIGYRNYLHNGILLILLGILYFFVSVYMYYKGTNTTMHEYLTYLVALYAFWQIGWAIHGMVQYKRKSNPILKAVKLTNFANALTSIVLTQVVLLDTFEKINKRAVWNGYLGMGVSLIIIIIGLYMIINIRNVEEKEFCEDM